MREEGAEEIVLPVGALLFRLYFRGGDHPGSWDSFRGFGPLRAPASTIIRRHRETIRTAAYSMPRSR